jgi:effector-binding domain-containing protein
MISAMMGMPLFAGEPVVKEIEPFHYACLEATGSFEQIPAKIGEFINTFMSQGLQAQGDLFGIYLNDPSQVAEKDLKWLVGFKIADDSAVAAPLKKDKFNYTKAVYYTHKGPYDTVGKSYELIYKFIYSNGYKQAGPGMELYKNDPSEVKPEDIETEIVIPVTK